MGWMALLLAQSGSSAFVLVMNHTTHLAGDGVCTYFTLDDVSKFKDMDTPFGRVANSSSTISPRRRPVRSLGKPVLALRPAPPALLLLGQLTLPHLAHVPAATNDSNRSRRSSRVHGL